MKELTKPLADSEIELRIGSAKAPKGFSVLAYKTARTDRNRLDEVAGCLNWQNKHYIDSHNNVVCSIGIWDKEKKEWVWKEDTGAESFTEKEKGSYSDSFKRAGFRWGIGIELYDFPFIWIQWDKWHKNNSGKDVPTVNLGGWYIKYMNDNSYKSMAIYDNYGNIMWNNLDEKPKEIVPKLKPLAELKEGVKKAFKMLEYSESDENLMIEEYLGDKPIAEDYEILLKKLRNEYKTKQAKEKK